MSIAPLGGTLTFLFTDIEGSTQLWEKSPEAMKLALARHDDILRKVIEMHGGCVFKTVGDAFYAAFTSAPDAASAALDAQRRIQAESWGETPITVRMAVHTGAVEMRDNDYFGPPLNRVARLMSAGHGGQILLSTITYELVCSSLPVDAELRDMGERGLKDLVRPERIYQLTASGLQAEFPPLKTLEAFRTNLPQQLTSFIGREKEIGFVKRLIAQHRLVTLTGAGGTGKTRLSLQVAADLLDSFPDGVWFVELAPLSDPALIPQTVLMTLGLREETGHPILETINRSLRAKKILLILDNCEHLVEAAAQFAHALLHTCTDVRLLTSSREVLGIHGEKACYVASLSIPDIHIPQSLAKITQYEAVNLFVDRAKTALASFELTDTNAFAVAQICAQLDGIPLAIELAAARVKMLKAEQIAQRLDDRFRLLTGGSRTALPRQQTLRAMIDWSYDLLSEVERILLRRLSVFAGGWTLEAAETICQGFGIDDYNVFDPLAQLVNKSLVVADADDAIETRYRLLETVRQYAREKLSGMGEGMMVRDLHLQYFLNLAERAEPELDGPHVVEWLTRIESELDNISVALEWSLNRDAQIGLRLFCALFVFWAESDYGHPAHKWLKLLLDRPESQVATPIRAKALTMLGFFLGHAAGNPLPILQESVALSRKLGDQQGTAFGLLYLGVQLFRDGDVLLSRKVTTESLMLYRQLGDKLGVAFTLSYLGSMVDNNEYDRTYAYLNESLTIFGEIGNLVGIARNLSNLGNLAIQHGHYEDARGWLEKSLAIQRKLGKAGSMIYTLTHLGELAARAREIVQARAYYEECLSLIHQAGGSLTDARWVLVKLAYTAMWQDDLTGAINLFIQSLQRFNEAQEKIGVVYTLEGIASMAARQKQPKRAAQLFAYANAARKILDSSRPPVEQADMDRDLALARAQCDEAGFAAAQAAGDTMNMDDAIAFAVAQIPN